MAASKVYSWPSRWAAWASCPSGGVFGVSLGCDPGLPAALALSLADTESQPKFLSSVPDVRVAGDPMLVWAALVSKQRAKSVRGTELSPGFRVI